MALMKRDNCELSVPEHRVEEYLHDGYSLIDEQGNVIKTNEPRNIGDYKRLLDTISQQAEYMDSRITYLEQQIREKDARIDQCEDDIDDLLYEAYVREALLSNAAEGRGEDEPEKSEEPEAVKQKPARPKK